MKWHEHGGVNEVMRSIVRVKLEIYEREVSIPGTSIRPGREFT